MAIKFSLDDIREYEREFPSRFHALSEREGATIKAGDIVKLIFRFEDGEFAQVERMWVAVTSAEGVNFTGKLDNEPFTKGCLKADDEVKFKLYNVLEIYER